MCEWNEEATVCRIFSWSLFDIVWDDPDFARCASCVAAGLPRRSAAGCEGGDPRQHK